MKPKSFSQTDPSIKVYTKYLATDNPSVEVVLKNGHHYKGTIVGFFKGDPAAGDPYILKWQITPEREAHTLGIDIVGTPIGNFIEQENIKQVKFLEDNVVIEC